MKLAEWLRVTEKEIDTSGHPNSGSDLNLYLVLYSKASETNSLVSITCLKNPLEHCRFSQFIFCIIALKVTYHEPPRLTIIMRTTLMVLADRSVITVAAQQNSNKK
jgi:hypothetical protein